MPGQLCASNRNNFPSIGKLATGFARCARQSWGVMQPGGGCIGYIPNSRDVMGNHLAEAYAVVMINCIADGVLETRLAATGVA